MATPEQVLQLAMFNAAMDAKKFGYSVEEGMYRPTWEERGLMGQDAYLTDAAVQFAAVEAIQAGTERTPE